MDVRRFGEFEDEPLCRFGPGGDYVRQWPGAGDKAPKPANPLRKVLEVIAEMMGTAIDPAMFADISVEGPTDVSAIGNDEVKEQGCERVDNKGCADNPAATGDTEADRAVPGQSMLFGDHGRTRRSRRRKSHHRIRAYRKPAKKRSSGQIEGQGTLFEIDGLGQSAA
jgi:hypothetical protein